MNISIAWLNTYLSPPNVTADEAEDVLMHVGFPIESRETLPSGDVRLDVEITSNRGDCLSHVGLAREIACKTGRSLVLPKADLPKPTPGIGRAADLVTLENTRPDLCPLFTIRVIRGVKVGGSPQWLRAAIESVGQRSISNVVDASNYVNFELGNPSHTFDMARLSGGKVVVRMANAKEKLKTLDGKDRTLEADDLVVADGLRAQGLAGVMGGGDSEVSPSTTDLVLEVATWAPVAVRKSARRHGLRTDASYRYERTVDARSLDFASRRLASIILEIAGGQLCEGVLTAGTLPGESPSIRLRPSRVHSLLGVRVPVEEIVTILKGLSVEVLPIGRAGEELACTPPHWRPDLTREVDLIEEIARVRGLAQIPVSEKISIAIRPPQNAERAQRELSLLLSGMGFYETITNSFVTPQDAEPFILPGQASIGVDDARRGAEPTLRPSILPSLLACRRKNQDGGVDVAGGAKLFEIAATFAQTATQGSSGPLGVPARGDVIQPRRLALLMDVRGGEKPSHADLQSSVREMHGVVESILRAMGGANATIEVRQARPLIPAVRADAWADIVVNGTAIGAFGLLSSELVQKYGLEKQVVVAEMNVQAVLSLYPPRGTASSLPEFPAAERDLTLILSEDQRWDSVEKLVAGARLECFERLAYVGSFRGEKLGAGKKATTLRLWFRDGSRTLRKEDVQPQINALIEAAKHTLNAEVRTA